MHRKETDLREWYIQIASEARGPLSIAVIQALAESELLKPDTLIRKGLEGKWVLLETYMQVVTTRYRGGKREK